MPTGTPAPTQVTAADALLGLKRDCNPTQPFGGLPDFEALIVGYASFCNGFSKVSSTSVSAIKNYIDTHQISGVKASGLTISYTLVHPASYFPDELQLDAFAPAPPQSLDYLPASAAEGQHIIADGPYKIQSYVPTRSIVYVRNPAWKASTDPIRKAYVNEIKVSETGNEPAVQQQLQTNTAAAGMEFDAFPPIGADPGLEAQMKAGAAGRMAGHVDGADAGRHLVARFDKSGSIRQRQRQLLEELQIEFARLAHVLAALPEIELGGAEDIARIGKDRLAAVHQAADMIGMAVRDHHDVDVGRLVAGLRQACDQPAFRQPAAQLRIVPRQRPVAGVEQDDLFAGVDHGRNERMHIAVRFDAVALAKALRLLGAAVRAEARVQAVTDHLAVEDIGDLKAAELEAINGGLQFALH